MLLIYLNLYHKTENEFHNDAIVTSFSFNIEMLEYDMKIITNLNNNLVKLEFVHFINDL